MTDAWQTKAIEAATEPSARARPRAGRRRDLRTPRCRHAGARACCRARSGRTPTRCST